eukprot:m.244319 g.244319  ORF g.244319 m.244319 type:complete len:577 (+) comp19470_c0_seq9:280-2010(+)
MENRETIRQRPTDEKSGLLGARSNGDTEDVSGSSMVPDTEEKISLWRKVAFGLGGPPNQLTHTLIGFQLNAFLLSDWVKLQPRIVGAIVLLGRVWDAIMDPTVGVMTTRTRSRWGSLRPWVLGGTLPLALSFFLVWTVPPWYSDDSRAAYVTVAYLMYNLSVSMYYVPYTALTVHISHNQREVDKATGWRMISETLAVFVAALLTKMISPITLHYYDECGADPDKMICAYRPEQIAFMIQAGVVSVLIIISSAIVLSNVQEMKLPKGASAPADPFITGFMKVVRTKSYQMLTMMFLWVWMAVAMVQANFLVYCSVALEIDFDHSSDLLLTLLGTTVASTPFWFMVMVKLGKKKTYIVSLCMLMVVCVSLYFMTASVSQAVRHVQFACFGLPLGAVYLVPAAMLPDVINEATLRDGGVRREALFYAYFVFFQKFGAGVAIYASNEVLESVGGYNSDKTPEENAGAIPTLRYLIAVVPASLMLISMIFATQYPLNTVDEKRIKKRLTLLTEGIVAEQTPDDPVKTSTSLLLHMRGGIEFCPQLVVIWLSNSELVVLSPDFCIACDRRKMTACMWMLSW